MCKLLPSAQKEAREITGVRPLIDRNDSHRGMLVMTEKENDVIDIAVKAVEKT